ncbi:PREDICTED: RWD domain-containing protein 1 [Dinoponera quadriceps]|uniref:RWD domain-containing protein 1 n=1 Tax=Dinoponera quadriceps TaxID=609295 RepID=A0A6P3X0F3_DINQU|nr:PREDICTED: RWD domain-containing protein 1 [Dinoponera quadriceps]XP_014471395.1 PREDICTED: RWD domain-containing protein 1 [Dinoponera quadriceps]
MDYKDEQRNEIEALESIYCGELEILAIEPFYTFAIPIKTEEYEPETENGLSCRLEFTYTSKYPDEPLHISITEQENFEGDDEKLKAHLAEQMSENLGMVMVFTLVSTAQEWLNVQWDKIKLKREETAAQKLIEEEEAERRRFEGTRVTVETFLSWKEKFDEEMGYKKRKELAEREGKKLTGRELFMTDKTLDQSDLKFLDDGDAVKVDESLFQNLDDLDLDDDDDDLDFDPNISDDSA